MSGEILFVFGLLAITIVVFMADRFRMDLVAITVMVVLALSGIVTPTQAVSGFGEPVVITIAALFVVGEALFRTGVAAAVGHWILKVGGNSETRLLLLLLPVIALLSAFMSSTGAVALLIPVVLSMARQSDLRASRVLMPMAFAALIGGMLTLIGTPPNIIVTDALVAADIDTFSFFAFTPLGLAVLAVGTLYLVGVARFLLPDRESPETGAPQDRMDSYFERYRLQDPLHRLRVSTDSPLLGKTILESALRTRYEVTVVGLRHADQRRSVIQTALVDTRIQINDELFVYGAPAAVALLAQEQNLDNMGLSESDRRRMNAWFGVSEILLTPESSLRNQTLKDLRFREHYSLNVIGVRRGSEPVATRYSDTPLHSGDSLLLAGSWADLRKLSTGRDFVITSRPAEMQDAPTHGEKAPLAIAIMIGMVVLMTTGALSNLGAVLLAALLMVMTGCLNLTEAYRSLNAQSLVLIAGMIPLALAMETSGAAALLIDQTLTLFGEANPLLIAAGLFVLTSVLSQFISNTATTVLMAPLTLGIAQGLGLSPLPFMMTIAIAASTAFATPIASPVNTLVVNPGDYRFSDFLKVGVPLQLLAMTVTLAVLPFLFPF